MHSARDEVDTYRVCFGSSDYDGASAGTWHGYQFASTLCAFTENCSQSGPRGDLKSPANQESAVARFSLYLCPLLATGFSQMHTTSSRYSDEKADEDLDPSSRVNDFHCSELITCHLHQRAHTSPATRGVIAVLFGTYSLQNIHLYLYDTFITNTY